MWHSFGLGFAQINPKVRNGPKAIHEAMTNLYPTSMKTFFNYEDVLSKGKVVYPRGISALLRAAAKEIGDIMDGKPDGFTAFGGEHLISYAVLKALSKYHKKLSVLHFDAHLDMMDRDPDPEGGREKYTRATWARRALEEFNVKKWVCVGIRDFDVSEMDFAIKEDVDVVYPHETEKARKAAMSLKPPLYVSFDIDALDPSISPSVSVPVPLGISMRDALSVLEKAPKPAGFDIVELAAPVDKHDRTAMAAVFLLREYLSSIYLR